jgi:hypothetical protein
MNAMLGLLAAATLLSSGLGPGEPAAPADRPAAEAAGRSARIGGVITSMADSGFALDTPSGGVTVVTSESTRFRIPGVEDPALGDLAVGDHVIAAGRRDEGGLFHAAVVAKVRTNLVVPVSGLITELGGDSLTIRTEKGSVAVFVDGGTTYVVRGVENATFDDLAVGMRALARAVLQGDGTPVAKTVAAAPAPPRPVQLRGQVTAISGRAFTLRTGEGSEIEVLTDDDTVFRILGVENPTIADLEVGDRVVGRALVDSEGVIRARYVAVVPDQLARVHGRVVGIDGRTLLLDTDDGRVRVVTDGDTKYRIPGVADPSFDDIEMGNLVLAAGSWQDEETFLAAGIAVRRQIEPPNTIRGRALNIGEDHLTIQTARGEVRVLVNDETVFRIRGVRDPGLEDIRPGALVVAAGEWTADSALLAGSVIAVTPGVSDALGAEAGADGLSAGKEAAAR